MKSKRPPSTSADVPVRIEPHARAAQNALAVHLRLPPIQGRTPGERINFLHALSVESGVVSIAAAIYAGWELSQVREKCTHGSWYAWLEKNTAISPDTALRYIGVYAKHLAEARAALPDPVPSTVPPSAEELATACANTDAKTLTDLYIQQGLVKRSSNWGGAREGSGRKAKGSVGEQLDAAAASETLKWSAAQTHLEALVNCFPTPESIARLNDERLGRLFAALFPILDEARKQMVARAKGSGNGKRRAQEP